MKPQLEEAAAMLRLADRDIAALFCHLIEFRRTHDLQRLADLLAEHGVRGPLSTDRLATLSPCAVLLRYDDAEIEVENVNRTELIQMVNTARAWAEGVFLAAVSTEADS